jgi:hypothetical protein
MAKYVHVRLDDETAAYWDEVVRRGRFGKGQAVAEALKWYAEELRFRQALEKRCGICEKLVESPSWYRMGVHMVPLCERCCNGVKSLANGSE